MADIKIKYLPAQRRVRVEFSKQDCLDAKVPPKTIYERAKKKLDDERSQGRIACYYLDFPGLVNIWRRMAASWEDPSTSVAVTLGAGSPVLPGIHLTESTHDNVLAELSINATPDELRQWRLHFLKITVAHECSNLGLTDRPNPADLHSYWLRAMAGEKISGAPVSSLPRFRNLDERRKRPYDIVVDPRQLHMYVVIHDIVSLLDVDVWEVLKSELKSQVGSLREKRGCVYHVLTDELLLRLRSALRGPERYGLDMPFVQLVATPLPLVKPGTGNPLSTTVPAGHPAGAKQAGAHARNDKLKKPQTEDLIQFEVNADKTEAKLTKISAKVLQRPGGITVELIKKYAQQAGITHGFIGELNELVKAPAALAGKVIAVASPGKAGEQPSLQSVFGNSNEDEEDIRNRGPKRFVRTGETIAIVAYDTPAIPGTDVTGQPLPAPLPSTRLAVTLGDGVKCDDGETYIATTDGTPVVEGDAIRVVPGYIHEGDVSISTGDIIFRGNVEIKGSVEHGATVKVRGDLVIEGDINGGHVFCSGNLTVKGSIRSSRGSGRITALGNLSAMFLESAEVYCNGNVTVANSIIASLVYCNGDLTVSSGEGLLAGGDIRTGGAVKSHSIGQDKGSITRIKTSIKWQIAKRLEITKGRLDKVKEAHNRYKSDVNELQKKRADQRTKKMTERLEHSRSMLTKSKSLMGRLDETLKSLTGTEYLSEEAKVFVPGTLSSNVEIMIASKSVKVTDNCENVEVSGTRRSGSYIHRMSGDDKSVA